MEQVAEGYYRLGYKTGFFIGMTCMFAISAFVILVFRR